MFSKFSRLFLRNLERTFIVLSIIFFCSIFASYLIDKKQGSISTRQVNAGTTMEDITFFEVPEEFSQPLTLSMLKETDWDAVMQNVTPEMIYDLAGRVFIRAYPEKNKYNLSRLYKWNEGWKVSVVWPEALPENSEVDLLKFIGKHFNIALTAVEDFVPVTLVTGDVDFIEGERPVNVVIVITEDTYGAARGEFSNILMALMHEGNIEKVNEFVDNMQNKGEENFSYIGMKSGGFIVGGVMFISTKSKPDLIAKAIGGSVLVVAGLIHISMINSSVNSANAAGKDQQFSVLDYIHLRMLYDKTLKHGTSLKETINHWKGAL